MVSDGNEIGLVSRTRWMLDVIYFEKFCVQEALSPSATPCSPSMDGYSFFICAGQLLTRKHAHWPRGTPKTCPFRIFPHACEKSTKECKWGLREVRRGVCVCQAGVLNLFICFFFCRARNMFRMVN